jgi:hypothetical protein
MHYYIAAFDMSVLLQLSHGELAEGFELPVAALRTEPDDPRIRAGEFQLC